MKCTKVYLQKLHCDFVQYNDNIMAHLYLFIQFFMIQSWFKNTAVIGWGIVNEWGVTPSFITAWAEWSVSLVSLSTTSLQTMTLCPSDPLPINAVLLFLLTAGASFSLSLALLFPLFDLNNMPVLPTTHCVDCLGGRRTRKRELEAAETKKHLAVLMHFV